MYDQMNDHGNRNYEQRNFNGRQERDVEYNENDDHYEEKMRVGRPPSVDNRESDRRLKEYEHQHHVRNQCFSIFKFNFNSCLTYFYFSIFSLCSHL